MKELTKKNIVYMIQSAIAAFFLAGIIIFIVDIPDFLFWVFWTIFYFFFWIKLWKEVGKHDMVKGIINEVKIRCIGKR